MATKPDYLLSVMDKITGAKSGNIGGAWRNASGALSIRLNPGTSLVYNPDLQIMLFPNDWDKSMPGEEPAPVSHAKEKRLTIRQQRAAAKKAQKPGQVIDDTGQSKPLIPPGIEDAPF